MYEENEDAMCDALAKDLHKSRQESIINEIELLRNDVRNLIMNFRSYAAVEYVSIYKFSPSTKIFSLLFIEYLHSNVVVDLFCSRRKRLSI